MKRTLTGAAALLVTAAPVFAAGIERSTQSIGILFEEGNYAELGGQFTNPDVSGNDLAIYGGSSTGGVADEFNVVTFGYKHQFTDQLSAALIIEHPYGADIEYTDFADGGSYMLGGTKANVESAMISGILRYKFNDSWGVHGGVRVSKASGDVKLAGTAYSQLSGYRAKLEDDTAAGWLLGGTWELPDIAARVALTYYSDIDHDFDTEETLNGIPVALLPGMPLSGDSTSVTTPSMLALDFQTGIATDTLLFGQLRRTYWSDFTVTPEWFGRGVPDGLVSLEDSNTFTLGVGRKFTEQWSGTVAFTYEPTGDDLVSPLAPTNGRKGVTVAGIYTMDNWKFTGGINYTKLGDATPETGTPDAARAEIEDSEAVSLGLRIGYRF
ncbi:OmpP1/FadL family transporter [Paracoccus aerodenitrificans]|uniref:OmpP1/FadL family transporter n=1 Tax=Paracoccus aerodenitrificans TaxID=3017781 RepID=UPI0022F0E6BD|nr:outer membrane protein transport protein [Paracoccus aerodenitrificans]WBU63346.1 outer membrane protein transport protein [Paracoccus aerodenitrificans]